MVKKCIFIEDEKNVKNYILSSNEYKTDVRKETRTSITFLSKAFAFNIQDIYIYERCRGNNVYS